MIDNTRAIVLMNKSRDNFIQFVEKNIPATLNSNMLLDKVLLESSDIDFLDDEQLFYLNTLSSLLYEFFIEEYKELEEYIHIDESEFYFFFPVGNVIRAYYIEFDFESEKNVRMLKLKHPRLIQELGL